MSSSLLCSCINLLDGSLSRFFGHCSCRFDFLCFRGGCQGFWFDRCTSGCSFFGGHFGSNSLCLGSCNLWDGLLRRGSCVLKSEVELIIDRHDKKAAYFFSSIRARLRG